MTKNAAIVYQWFGRAGRRSIVESAVEIVNRPVGVGGAA